MDRENLELRWVLWGLELVIGGLMEMSGGDVTTNLRGTATGGGAGCEFVPPLTVVDLWETSGGAGCASCVR